MQTFVCSIIIAQTIVCSQVFLQTLVYNFYMKNKLAENLTELLETRNISKRQLARDIGVSSTIITYWANGQKQPTAEFIIILADYFNVCTDYLLGRQEWY